MQHFEASLWVIIIDINHTSCFIIIIIIVFIIPQEKRFDSFSNHFIICTNRNQDIDLLRRY